MNSTTSNQIDSLDSAATGLAGGNNLRGDNTAQGGVANAGLVPTETHGSHAHHDGLGSHGSHAGRDTVTSGAVSGGVAGTHAKQALPSAGLAGGVDHHANAHGNAGTYGDSSLGFTPGLVSAHQPAHTIPNNPDGANFDRQPNLDEHLHATGTPHVGGQSVAGSTVGGDHSTTGETRGVHRAFRVGLAGADQSHHAQETEAGRSKTHFPHLGNAVHSTDGTTAGAHGGEGHPVKKDVQTTGGFKMNVA